MAGEPANRATAGFDRATDLYRFHVRRVLPDRNNRYKPTAVGVPLIVRLTGHILIDPFVPITLIVGDFLRCDGCLFREQTT